MNLQTPSTVSPSIVLNDLCLGFRLGRNQEKILFEQINGKAYPGELVALIGANGRGKSTLLRCLCGLGAPLRGSLSLDQNDVAYVPSHTPRTRHFAVVDLLATACYHRSDWLGNIGTAEEEKIRQALEQVGLSGFEYRDTAELSDGEFQRVTLAAALVKGSSIIVLDEPTAFLDIANKLVITELLKNLAQQQQKTIVFSTHDLQPALKACDRIWLMGYDGFYDKRGPEAPLDKLFQDFSISPFF